MNAQGGRFCASSRPPAVVVLISHEENLLALTADVELRLKRLG